VRAVNRVPQARVLPERGRARCSGQIRLDDYLASKRQAEAQGLAMAASGEPVTLPDSSAARMSPPSTAHEPAITELCSWSAVAGVLARTAVQPLDTIRARVMVSSKPLSIWETLQRAGTESCARYHRRLGRFGAFVRSLYRGYTISVLVQAPAVATYLTVYEKTKFALAEFEAASRTSPHRRPLIDLSASSPWNHLCSGLAAETVSAVFWTPMEVMKQRAQVATCDADATLRTLARRLWTEEGARALFRGYLLTIGVFGPYAMLYFVTYERLKRWWSRFLTKSESLPSWSILASAAASGAVAAACTTPLDVLKTRLQTTRMAAGERLSLWRMASALVREQGYQALLRGLGPRVLWIVPNTAITMTAFEYFKAQASSRTVSTASLEGVAS
jgi:solute carrier family 25 iron transporter 28/37